MSTYSAKKAWRYFERSVRLHCPVCGISPLFPPMRRVEGMLDFFTTLPGCPYCGCTYEREPGYYLFATGFVNFGLAVVVGTALLFLLSAFFELSTVQLFFFVLLPMWLISILSLRHAEAFFLAIDHFFDPDFDEPD